MSTPPTSGFTFTFSAPIGGAPDALDLAPSIVFACLYTLMIPVIIWRMAHPRSRSVALLVASAWTLEHAASFSVRAAAAMSPALRENQMIETYFQISYSCFFISIGQDLVKILRTLLVSSTLGGDMLARHTLTPAHVGEAESQARKGSDIEPVEGPLAGGEPGTVYEVKLDASDEAVSITGVEFQFVDQTKLRQKLRTRLGVAALLLVLASTSGGVAGGLYRAAMNGLFASVVRALWYASDTLSVTLLVTAASVAVFALFKMPRVPRASLLWIILVACLLSIVGIYRLTIFGRSTTSLFSEAPGAQNSTREKATFYVLHAVPEFVAAAILLSLNARRAFGAGLWGDLRIRDPKPEPGSEQLGHEGADEDAGSSAQGPKGASCSAEA